MTKFQSNIVVPLFASHTALHKKPSFPLRISSEFPAIFGLFNKDKLNDNYNLLSHILLVFKLTSREKNKINRYFNYELNERKEMREERGG